MNRKILSLVVLLAVGQLVTTSLEAATPINLYQGVWSSTATYQAGNTVTYNNQTFLSLVSRNQAVTPGAAGSTAFWQLLGANIAGPQGPAGPTGAQGPQGPMGLTGAQGPIGPIGLTGAQGLPGAKGDTGATGPAGPTGAAGTAGKSVLNGTVAPTATVGTLGDFYLDNVAKKLYGPKVAATTPDPTGWGAGFSVVGPTGATGATGPAGPTGATGATGPTGPAGPQGPMGLTGAAGPAGPKGDMGLPGVSYYNAQEGDPCTLPSAEFMNTGTVLKVYLATGGPVPNQTIYFKCIDKSTVGGTYTIPGLGTYKEILVPTPAGYNSYTTNLNDNGVLIGYLEDSNGVKQGFYYFNAEFRLLGTLGGLGSVPNDVNTYKQIVGNSQTADGVWHAFMYYNGTMQDLGSFGTATNAWRINDNGYIGINSSNGTNNTAYLYHNGLVDTLRCGSDSNSGVSYVDKNNNAAGSCGVAGSYQAAFWINGVASKNGRFNSAITDGNNLGQYVGFSNGWADVSAAFWASPTATSVDTGIYLSAYRSTAGPGINDNGVISGISRASDNTLHAYVSKAGITTDLTVLAGLLGDRSATVTELCAPINNLNYIAGTKVIQNKHVAVLLMPIAP